MRKAYRRETNIGGIGVTSKKGYIQKKTKRGQKYAANLISLESLRLELVVVVVVGIYENGPGKDA